MDLMELCSDKAKQDKLCGSSSYHAAGDRKGRAANRRATGRFLLGCPHLLLLRMATMPAAYGHERYGYAYLMMAGEWLLCWFVEAIVLLSTRCRQLSPRQGWLIALVSVTCVVCARCYEGVQPPKAGSTPAHRQQGVVEHCLCNSLVLCAASLWA